MPATRRKDTGRRNPPAASKPLRSDRLRDPPPLRSSAPRRPPARRQPTRDRLYDDPPPRRPRDPYPRAPAGRYDDYASDYPPPRRNPPRAPPVGGQQPKSWRDFAKTGMGTLTALAEVPYFKARQELDRDEKAAQAWLAKDDAGRAAQQAKEENDAKRAEAREKREARKDGNGKEGVDRYVGAKKAVEEEKERLLEDEPGVWPGIVRRRGEEGNPVLVRDEADDAASASGGEGGGGRGGLKVSQESDRGLGATLLGGAAGAYIGDHTKPGLLGSVAGALVGALGGRVVEKRAAKRKREKEFHEGLKELDEESRVDEEEEEEERRGRSRGVSASPARRAGSAVRGE